MSDTVPALPPVHGRAELQRSPTVAPADWDLSHIHFADVLSALNPLQYVPVVGMIYREMTGDKVHPGIRIAVSAATTLLFGGPVGLAATMIWAVGSEVADARTSGSPARWAEAAAAYGRSPRAV